MQLTVEEQKMLDGYHGKAIQQAIKYQIKVGKYYDAKRFDTVSQAYITADIEVMVDVGLDFLKNLTENQNGKFSIPATSNARCIEFDEGSTLGQKEEMIAKERQVIDTVKNHGAMTIDSRSEEHTSELQ